MESETNSNQKPKPKSRKKNKESSIASLLEEILKQEPLFKETVLDDYGKHLAQAKKEDIDALNLVVSEFLDSYLIIGTKPNGEILTMRRNNSQTDGMAIDHVLIGLVQGSIKF